MKRNYLALAALSLLSVFALWMLPRAFPKAPPIEMPTQRGEVSEESEEDVQMVARKLRREVATAPVTSPQFPSEALGPNEETKGSGGLYGIVKELGGTGAPDVLLELVDSTGLAIASATSGEDGSFAFDQAARAGLSLITEMRSGFGPRLRHPRSLGSRSRRPGSRSSAKVVVWIPPPGSIEGIVIDSAGRPVEGALVETDRPIILMNMAPWEVLEGADIQMPSFVKTDIAGHFVLPFTKCGSHQLRASHDDGEASAKCKTGERAVVLQLGTHLDGAVVFEGRLWDRGTGAPISNERVSVQLVREWPHGHSSVSVARTHTNDKGRYEVQGLKVGHYQLSTFPNGYAPSRTLTLEYGEGRHTIDFALNPACQLLVNVVLPDGSPYPSAKIRVLDASGRRLQVSGPMKMLTGSLPVDKAGQTQLRLLPSAPLSLLAVHGDLFPAGELEVDLSTTTPESVTIVMPTNCKKFARKHYFKLLGPDGKPAEIKGTILAESYDGNALLSRVEGHWHNEGFVFGHDESNGFKIPTIAIGAPQGKCRVEIQVPGYETETLTLEPGAKSPTVVRLQR